MLIWSLRLVEGITLPATILSIDAQARTSKIPIIQAALRRFFWRNISFPYRYHSKETIWFRRWSVELWRYARKRSDSLFRNRWAFEPESDERYYFKYRRDAARTDCRELFASSRTQVEGEWGRNATCEQSIHSVYTERCVANSVRDV